MAITAKINVTTGIGRATITQPNKSTIVAQNFAPKPDVSINQIGGITTAGVQDGFTFIFNSDTNEFEAAPAADVTGQITQITGGTF
jgi:hypothetical protein